MDTNKKNKNMLKALEVWCWRKMQRINGLKKKQIMTLL
jgi:hypothetical protein